MQALRVVRTIRIMLVSLTFCGSGLRWKRIYRSRLAGEKAKSGDLATDFFCTGILQVDDEYIEHVEKMCHEYSFLSLIPKLSRHIKSWISIG
jgi:hypothetical protein